MAVAVKVPCNHVSRVGRYVEASGDAMGKKVESLGSMYLKRGRAALDYPLHQLPSYVIATLFLGVGTVGDLSLWARRTETAHDM
jgi:hypothetical protein